MKKKILALLFILIILLLPIKGLALSNDYEDKLSDLLNVEEKKDVINIYFFWGDGCPHCAKEEKFLDTLEEKYGSKIKIYRYETWNNSKNNRLMQEAKEKVGALKKGVTATSVPFTVIGTKYYSGYSESTATRVTEQIDKYLKEEELNQLHDSYVDLIKDIVNVKQEDGVVNVYFFYGDGCPHCAKEEKFFKLIEKKYGNKVHIYSYETWNNKNNKELMIESKKVFDAFNKGVTEVSVPFTVIGDKYFAGYSDSIGEKIEKKIAFYLNEKVDKTVIDENVIELPLLGEVNATDTTVGFAAILLGFVDGFNPCAMWILLFIIDMLFGLKNKKKMFILGYAFLITSAAFYFISMLGINVVLGFISTTVIRKLIGIVAIIAGIYNLYTYYKERKEEDGCHVVDNKKRKKIVTKLKKIKNARNFFIALVGIMALAISVNMVELACSAGFPAIFAEILVANDVRGIARVLYILLYVFFYMIDDLVVFTIAVSTLSITGISTKYNKIVKVVGGIIMIIMGLLLIFHYNWLTLDF